MYNWIWRKKLRLENYNYSRNWFYFVTICTKNREHYFGSINDWKVILNNYWIIVEEEILKTEKLRKEIKIDKFIIMPNHIHLIIQIYNIKLNKIPQNSPQTKNNLSNWIQWIKASITRKIRKENEDYIFWWQKSFYDIIIKNDEQLNKTREYIKNNPIKWEKDINYKKNHKI